jgi:hypothetical protein
VQHEHATCSLGTRRTTILHSVIKSVAYSDPRHVLVKQNNVFPAELDLKAALADTGVAVLSSEAFTNDTETAATLRAGRKLIFFTVSRVAMMYARNGNDKLYACAMDMVSGDRVPGVTIKLLARDPDSVRCLPSCWNVRWLRSFTHASLDCDGLVDYQQDLAIEESVQRGQQIFSVSNDLFCKCLFPDCFLPPHICTSTCDKQFIHEALFMFNAMHFLTSHVEIYTL